MTRRDRLKFPDFFLLGTLGVILVELFFIPNATPLKSVGGLGTIYLAGFRFVASELVLLSFFALSPIMVMGFPNRERLGRLAPTQYSGLVVLLLMLCVLSLIWGALRRNPLLMTEFRAFFLSVPLFFVFYFVDFSPKAQRLALKMIVWVLFAFQVLYFVGFFFPGIIEQLVRDPSGSGPLLGLTCSLATTSYFLAQVVSGTRSFTWTVLFMISTLTVIIHIGFKPVIMGTIVVWATVFLIGIRGGAKTFGRIWGVTIVVYFGLTTAFVLAPSNLKADLVGRFVSRFLKVSNVVSISEINSSLFEVAGSEGEDVGSGRFEIWSLYMRESVKGFGFSRNGFGHDPQIYMTADELKSKGKHNIIVYVAYEFGIFAGLVAVILLGKFIYVEVFHRNRKWVEEYSYRTEPECIAMVSFVCATISTAMVGTAILMTSVAFVFWFCVAALCKERDRINWALREQARLANSRSR